MLSKHALILHVWNFILSCIMKTLGSWNSPSVSYILHLTRFTTFSDAHPNNTVSTLHSCEILINASLAFNLVHDSSLISTCHWSNVVKHSGWSSVSSWIQTPCNYIRVFAKLFTSSLKVLGFCPCMLPRMILPQPSLSSYRPHLTNTNSLPDLFMRVPTDTFLGFIFPNSTHSLPPDNTHSSIFLLPSLSLS